MVSNGYPMHMVPMKKLLYVLKFLGHIFLYLFISHPITNSRIDLIKSTPLYLQTTQVEQSWCTYLARVL